MKQLFPHISRIFTAKTFFWVGNLCLWVLLFTLISFNIFMWNTKPLAYSDNISQIFTNPNSAPAHENLAQLLRSSGARVIADQEFAIAAEISPVLGISTTAKTHREEADTIYWQNILTSHPDYRDAYVQLGALSYGEGNLTQAHAYLLKAQILDPNNSTVNRLTAFTSKLLE